MLKYARVINDTGLCEIGTGTNYEFYQSIGMTELDVQQSDVDGNWYLSDKCPMRTEEEKKKEERERLDALSVTRGDMFEALILAKQKTKADLRIIIEKFEGLSDIERMLYLNRFDEALDFFRGHPAVNLIGKELDITTEQMDRYFETNDWQELIKVEEHEEPTDEESTEVGEENSAGEGSDDELSSNPPADDTEDVKPSESEESINSSEGEEQEIETETVPMSPLTPATKKEEDIKPSEDEESEEL